MCEFLSWIKKGNKVYYLTLDMVHNTPRGECLRDLPQDDLVGHGAIRLYYGLERDEGENYECTDFSSPDNFPTVLVRAIKAGEFRGMAIAFQLLIEPAYAEYQKVRQAAYAEYEKVEQPALAEYQKVEQPAWAEYQKVKQPAYAEYQKVRQAAYAEYEKVEQPALAEYQKVEQPALAEYQKVEQPAFWDLFAVPKNRIKAWR